MLTGAPNPRSVFPPPVALPVWTPVTPACSVASCAQSLPFRGVLRTAEALTSPPQQEEDWPGGAALAAILVTDSGLLGCMTMWMTRSAPTPTEIPVHSWVTNPGFDTVNSYPPGGRAGML